jgi:predicted regulator of Ras-like GTPase activity (Roadblock/LC7/MglB family)
MSSIQDNLNVLMEIDGAIATCIADSSSGMLLGKAGSGVDLELAAAANTEVVRAKKKAIQALGLNDTIEDILITLGKQYHIIRPMETHSNLFIYLVLDKEKANLALARHKTKDVEAKIVV